MMKRVVWSCSLRKLSAVFAISIIVAFGFNSCKENDVATTPTTIETNFALILNQGQFGKDNASISRFDSKTGSVLTDLFGDANSGLKLGADANDALIIGDTCYVTATGSRVIEIFRITTGKSLGRIRFDGAGSPWKMTLLSNGNIAVTTLYANDVVIVDPRTRQIVRTIAVRSVPEGITSFGNTVVVANSGYGDSLYINNLLSVVDAETGTTIKEVIAGPNVRFVIVNANKTRYYALYQHFWYKPDSLGGVVEYDATTHTELRRWRGRFSDFVAFDFEQLMVRTDSSIVAINTTSNVANEVETVIQKPTSLNSLYGATWNSTDDTFWLTDARDYSSNGAVFVVSNTGTIVRQFNVGVNPFKVIFR